MVINKIFWVIHRFTRKHRMKRFLHTLNIKPCNSILDVGGTPENWKILGHDLKITLLNLDFPDVKSGFLSQYSYVKGNGMNLPYPDKSFDVLFSNSAIDHLSDYEKQMKFANELRRVGRNLWIQAPSRRFFIEPHLITPFIHYLPKRWQKPLLRNFTVWGLLIRPSNDDVDNFLGEIRMLTYNEMKSLFPDCIILREKILFFTKCFIAVRQ